MKPTTSPRAFLRPAQALALALIIAAPAIVSIPPGREGAATGDGIAAVEEFNLGESQARLVFEEGGHRNTTLISIPAGAVLLRASMNISGELYTQNMPRGWTGETDQVLPTLPPSSFCSTMFSEEDYTSSMASDDDRQTTAANGSAPYTHAAFNLTTPPHNVTTLNVTWEGRGHWEEAAVQPYRACAYLWNRTAGAWDELGKYSGDTPDDRVFFRDMGSWEEARHYVDAASTLHILALGPTGAVNGSWVSTDSVSMAVEVDGGPTRVLHPDNGNTSFPSDVSVDVGGDGAAEWSAPGPFDGVHTMDGGDMFAAALQALVNASGAEEGNISIPVNVTTSAAGIVRLKDLKITVELPVVDGPPFMTAPFPDHLGFPEDSGGGYRLLDLNAQFSDGLDPGMLTFELIPIDVMDGMEAVVDADEFISATQLRAHVFGSSLYRLNVTDRGLDGAAGNSDDMFLLTDPFTITISPTPDAPEILAVGGEPVQGGLVELTGSRGAVEDAWFNGSVEVQELDGDGLEFTPDVANEYFQVDPASGNFTLMPRNGDVGVFTFRLTARDVGVTEPGAHMVKVNIDVANTNDAPSIIEVAGMEVTEGPVEIPPGRGAKQNMPFTFCVDAFDPDTLVTQDERLSFDTNRSDGKGSDDIPGVWVDGATGEVTIMPSQRESSLGSLWIEVKVTDLAGASDSVEVLVPIEDINYPPPPAPILSPAGGAVYDTTTITFTTVEVADPDGDSLTYSWDFDVSDGFRTYIPGLNVTYTYPGGGNYTAMLAVSDGREEALTQVTFSIRLKDPGGGTGGGGGGGVPDGGGATDGGGAGGGGTAGEDLDPEAQLEALVMWFAAIIVVLLAVIAAILAAMYINGRARLARNRRWPGDDDGDGEDDGGLDEGQYDDDDDTGEMDGEGMDEGGGETGKKLIVVAGTVAPPAGSPGKGPLPAGPPGEGPLSEGSAGAPAPAPVPRPAPRPMLPKAPVEDAGGGGPPPPGAVAKADRVPAPAASVRGGPDGGAPLRSTGPHVIPASTSPPEVGGGVGTGGAPSTPPATTAGPGPSPAAAAPVAGPAPRPAPRPAPASEPEPGVD